MQEKILSYTQISHGFQDKAVLRNLNGNILNAQLYVVTGENGSGKSTFLNILSGGIAPIRGEVNGIGFDKNSISYFYGESFLYPLLSVRENVEIFSSKNLEACLSKFEISQYQHKLVSELSKGFIQRVCLSIVLCGESKIVVVDEPTNFLDSQAKSLLVNYLREGLDRGQAIVISSHEPELFRDLGPVYLRLKEGVFCE